MREIIQRMVTKNTNRAQLTALGGMGAFGSLLAVALIPNFFGQFFLCESEYLAGFVQDMIFIMVYGVGLLSALLMLMDRFIPDSGPLADLSFSDNEKLTSYLRKFALAFFGFIAVDLVFSVFLEQDISCLLPGIPPEPGGVILTINPQPLVDTLIFLL